MSANPNAQRAAVLTATNALLRDGWTLEPTADGVHPTSLPRTFRNETGARVTIEVRSADPPLTTDPKGGTP